MTIRRIIGAILLWFMKPVQNKELLENMKKVNTRKKKHKKNE
jgi:hypothetical protein